MPNYLHRTTLDYQTSISPADLREAVGNYVKDPDLTAVAGFDSRYWILTGDIVTLMGQTARDAVDAAEAQAAIDANRANEKLRIDDERVLKALALIIMDEINILRVQHALADRTPSQLINAIKARVDSV